MPLLKINQAIQPIIQPKFNVDAAIAYNTKSKSFFQPYENDIKRILGISVDWVSPEFAKAVYDWQQKNGLSGKLIDGKFGPITMAQMAKADSTLNSKYDVYASIRAKHQNEEPSNRVVALTNDTERIRQQLGATNIPLNMLMGWIQVESNGNIKSKGLPELDERGLFQGSKDESAAIGLDHDRVASDKEYSIYAGIRLAQYHAKAIDKILIKHSQAQKWFSKDSEMYWRLTFFSFAAGDGTTEKLIVNMINSGEEFSNWGDVMKFVALNPTGYKHSPIKWSAHTDRSFNLGNKILQQAGKGASIAVYLRIKRARREARSIMLCDLTKHIEVID